MRDLYKTMTEVIIFFVVLITLLISIGLSMCFIVSGQDVYQSELTGKFYKLLVYDDKKELARWKPVKKKIGPIYILSMDEPFWLDMYGFNPVNK